MKTIMTNDSLPIFIVGFNKALVKKFRLLRSLGFFIDRLFIHKKNSNRLSKFGNMKDYTRCKFICGDNIKLEAVHVNAVHVVQ